MRERRVGGRKGRQGTLEDRTEVGRKCVTLGALLSFSICSAPSRSSEVSVEMDSLPERPWGKREAFGPVCQGEGTGGSRQHPPVPPPPEPILPTSDSYSPCRLLHLGREGGGSVISRFPFPALKFCNCDGKDMFIALLPCPPRKQSLSFCAR